MLAHGILDDLQRDDGIECDFLEFTSGLKAHITLAPQRGYLVA
jgi:hypothetical protein